MCNNIVDLSGDALRSLLCFISGSVGQQRFLQGVDIHFHDIQSKEVDANLRSSHEVL